MDATRKRVLLYRILAGIGLLLSAAMMFALLDRRGIRNLHPKVLFELEDDGFVFVVCAMVWVFAPQIAALPRHCLRRFLLSYTVASYVALFVMSSGNIDDWSILLWAPAFPLCAPWSYLFRLLTGQEVQMLYTLMYFAVFIPAFAVPFVLLKRLKPFKPESGECRAA